jgi:hypothetical protein
MATMIFATRSSAAKIRGQDYRTVGKINPDAELIRADGELVPLYLIDPISKDLANTEQK